MMFIRPMLFLMFDQIRRIRASETANVALVRFLARMGPTMDSHLAFVAGRLVAEVAFDGFLARVDSFMDDELAFGGAGFGTETADEATVIRVGQGVTDKLVGVGQGLAVTAATFPSTDGWDSRGESGIVGRRAMVVAEMGLQFLCGSEREIAKSLFAVIRDPLTCVVGPRRFYMVCLFIQTSTSA
ncbi:MAG: hypothetical protein Q9174_004492 [Haloplaca sp. 1 TL-2023]